MYVQDVLDQVRFKEQYSLNKKMQFKIAFFYLPLLCILFSSDKKSNKIRYKSRQFYCKDLH